MLCTPVYIVKLFEHGMEYRPRYFCTKPIRATTKKAIFAALKGTNNSILLQAKHLYETGSGWSVTHCCRLDSIITVVNGVSFLFIMILLMIL